MKPTPGGARPVPPHAIELRVREVTQLFNTMDPSPFHERDLDQDAEEFIVSWAQEFPVRDPLRLLVYVDRPATPADESLVEQAVHHYFQYRSGADRRELRQLMQEGRFTLFAGLLFLAACLVAGRLIGDSAPGTLPGLARESLTIGGWVAMWRPMEIYLYAWWPVLRRCRIHAKLGRMPVTVKRAGDSA